jgi:hypothetical protein
LRAGPCSCPSPCPGRGIVRVSHEILLLIPLISYWNCPVIHCRQGVIQITGVRECAPRRNHARRPTPPDQPETRSKIAGWAVGDMPLGLARFLVSDSRNRSDACQLLRKCLKRLWISLIGVNLFGIPRAFVHTVNRQSKVLPCVHSTRRLENASSSLRFS